MQPPLIRLKTNHPGRDGSPYRPNPGLRAAAETALLLQAPLLLAGEPGCGKTDFAWFVARALGAALGAAVPDEEVPLECYVHSNMRARDLLYHYDALARFADAHHAAASAGGRPSEPRYYIRLAAFGRALMSHRRRVVLIDEIDKAPRDFPNDLLRELDQGHFTIVEIPPAVQGEIADEEDSSERIPLQRDMRRASHAGAKPLIIVTSNAERQLPDAFLRRCVFFHIDFPKHDELLQILKDRFPNFGGDSQDPVQQADFLNDCVTVAEALRRPAVGLTKIPGTAEIIGWVRALTTLGQQTDWDNRDAPGETLRQLRIAAQEARGKDTVHWSLLPRLHCLVKLKEDLATLGLRSRTI